MLYKLFRNLVVLLLAVLPCMVQAQAFKTETGHVEFHSEVPLHSFTGTSDHLVGLINLADSTVDFYLDLTTLKTGIGKRDKDMRSTLETEKYPFAEFYGKLISDFDPEGNAKQDVKVRGEFKIHGVSRQIEVDGALQKTTDGLRLTASWTINIENYDIEPPGILFYRVDKNQDIEIDALLTPTETEESK